MAKDATKKRKRDHPAEDLPTAAPDTSKPTAVFRPSKGRPYTVSVALPGSIIANALTHDLKTALAGHIARALAVFCVDEIVIFNDGHTAPPPRNFDPRRQALAAQDEENGYTAFSDPGHFLFHVLSYLETPPYLRRALFPYHPNLRTAGALPSLDMPHHLRAEEWCLFREGVTVDGAEDSAETVSGKKAAKKQHASTTPVNAGFASPVSIPTSIPPNTRVTLQFPSAIPPSPNDTLTAIAVSPDTPSEEGGYYWGYTPRLASSLSAVFTECPYDGGYDYSIGTSERGIPLPTFLADASTEGGAQAVPKWSHLLVVFGGLAGLEQALKADEELRGKVEQASELFDAWVNLVEGQGSRTIRTEEAVWIGLMGLRGVVVANDAKW